MIGWGRHVTGWGFACDRMGLSCDRMGLLCDKMGLSCDRMGFSCNFPCLLHGIEDWHEQVCVIVASLSLQDRHKPL